MAAMWPIIAGLTVVLAQAVQSLPGSKGQEWCFDRGQETQLCEATEAACNQLRALNTEIAKSPCIRVEPSDIHQSPTEPPAPPNPARQTPTQR
jgi:hypothetical protein